jgi:hypothetical protein
MTLILLDSIRRSSIPLRRDEADFAHADGCRAGQGIRLAPHSAHEPPGPPIEFAGRARRQTVDANNVRLVRMMPGRNRLSIATCGQSVPTLRAQVIGTKAKFVRVMAS